MSDQREELVKACDEARDVYRKARDMYRKFGIELNITDELYYEAEEALIEFDREAGR